LAGFNKNKAELFSQRQLDTITCYHLHSETWKKVKSGITKGILIDKARKFGLDKAESNYAIGYGVGRLTAAFEARPGLRKLFVSKIITDCR
jgi:hypothetical protein